MPDGFVSFADVKRGVSLEAVLARYDLLEGMARKGQNLAGPCPFCKGKSGRQFQVNPIKNAWYCFGCKAGGNVLDFVAKSENVGIRAAALKLDSWFELGLKGAPPAQPPPSPSLSVQEASEEALPDGNPLLPFTLKTLDPNHASLAALCIQPETLQLFGAGYCTKGLLKERLAIPIHNESGELVAYAGLALRDGEAPRYLFPPKFHPALEVFNLHRLGIALKDGPLYLAPEIEGVLRLTESGAAPVVGLFDGTLSPCQEEAIRGALTPCDRLVLVGEGFPDRTVARLARHAAVTWMPELSFGLPKAGAR